jgi:hypothetical protein
VDCVRSLMSYFADLLAILFASVWPQVEMIHLFCHYTLLISVLFHFLIDPSIIGQASN